MECSGCRQCNGATCGFKGVSSTSSGAIDTKLNSTESPTLPDGVVQVVSVADHNSGQLEDRTREVLAGDSSSSLNQPASMNVFRTTRIGCPELHVVEAIDSPDNCFLKRRARGAEVSSVASAGGAATMALSLGTVALWNKQAMATQQLRER